MSQWKTLEDPVSGRTYYANMITQETSWTLPTAFDNNHQYPSHNEYADSIEPQQQGTNCSSQFNTTRRNTIQSMVHFDAVWDSDGVSEGGDSWDDSDSDSCSNDGLTIYSQNKPIQITHQTDEKTQGQLQHNLTNTTPSNPGYDNQTYTQKESTNNVSNHKYPTPEIITLNNNQHWECKECAFKNDMNCIICKICNVPKIKKHPNDSSEGREKNIILSDDMFDEENNYDIPYDLMDLLNKNKNETQNRFILENSALQESSDDDIDEQENENEGWTDINENGMDKQLLSEIVAIIDSHPSCQNMSHLMTSFATHNNQSNHSQSHRNSGNNCNNCNNCNNSNNNENGDQNQSNDGNNNGHNNSGNGGRRDNNRDDDEKDRKYFNSNNEKDEEDENEEEDEKEKEEEKKEEYGLNKNAKEFVPNYPGCKPAKRRTLSPIDEKQMCSHAKISVKPRKASKMNKILTNSYDPNPKYRAKFNVEIARDFTTHIAGQIKEQFNSLYAFMDKSLSFQNNVFNNQIIKIINYGFHDKHTDELLYCIIVRKQKQDNSKNKRKWQMLSKLFTAKDIKQIYNISSTLLPKRIQSLEWKSDLLNEQNMIKNKLMNSKEIETIINSTSWHKLRVFNSNYNRNRKRMILKLDKPEFMRNLRSFVNVNINNNNPNINLIPIMMFDNTKDNKYQIEYLWIVRIDKQNSIDIGISFVFDENNNNNLIVSGIHLNKTIIIKQHDLISSHSYSHLCDCLHAFTSNISDLKIGNPDDELNKIKDLTKKFKTVSQQLSIKNNELDKTKEELKRFQMENEKLKAMIESYNNSAQSTPELNTNVNSVTSSVPLQSPLYSSSMIIQPNSFIPSVPNSVPLLNNNNNNNNVPVIIQQPLFYPYQMPNGAVILIPNQVSNNI